MAPEPVRPVDQKVNVPHGAQLRGGVILGQHTALKGEEGDLLLGEMLLQLGKVPL